MCVQPVATRLAWTLLSWSLLLVSAGAARAQTSDVIRTEGAYDRFAVGNAHRWYDSHTTEARQRAGQCLSLLDEAKVDQDEALALDERARQPGLGSRQASELRRRANEQFGLRDKKIRAFIDCFNRANRREAPPSDQLATGGDTPSHDEDADPGEKSVHRTPGRTPEVPGGPDANVRIAALEAGIDDCMSLALPSYPGTDWDRVVPESTGAGPSGALQRSFFLSGAAADQFIAFVRARHDDESASGLNPDCLIGWLTSCLMDRSVLSRQEPRILYRRFMEAHEPAGHLDKKRITERFEEFGYCGRLYPSIPLLRDPSPAAPPSPQ